MCFIWSKKFFLYILKLLVIPVMAIDWEALLADIERVVRSLRDEIAESNKLLKALLIVELYIGFKKVEREKIIELISKSRNMSLEELLAEIKKRDP